MTQSDPGRGIPPRLELRDVGLRFGAVRALDGIDLAVRPGEIVALLGDSGCGKSTLLRAIAGLEQPERGTIRLDGTDVGDVPAEARGVGLMFQDYALFPHLTAAENVRFGLHAQPGKAARAIATARLEQVGLAHRAASYPGTLSGGESQRVALARALAPGPRILLLDEPFSNLDRRTRDRVRADTLALLRETGTTAILVTHDPEEALGFADRIALMRGGRIVQVGTGGRPLSPTGIALRRALLRGPRRGSGYLPRRLRGHALRPLPGAGPMRGQAPSSPAGARRRSISGGRESACPAGSPPGASSVPPPGSRSRPRALPIRWPSRYPAPTGAGRARPWGWPATRDRLFFLQGARIKTLSLGFSSTAPAEIGKL